jgi:hypothetical protein
LILAVAAAGVLAGCGSAGPGSSKRELALQRAQLVQVSDGLRAVEASVRREVGASRVAWPSIADGLPRTPDVTLRASVGRASVVAGALRAPPFMAHASELTGPAAGIAGSYESYDRLAERGWRLTETTIAALASGPPTVASFARQNSSLYIDAIYDGHFDLSLMGSQLTEGYERLGGAAAFGANLTPAVVGALAAAYSIPAVRLEPHPGHALEER